MSILVALKTPSLIANSSALEAVVLLAGVFEDDIWWPNLQKCAAVGIGLATSSQQSVVLNSVRTTIFLTFSALSMIGMCWMFPVPAIVTLSNPRVYSSPLDCSCVILKVK